MCLDITQVEEEERSAELIERVKEVGAGLNQALHVAQDAVDASSHQNAHLHERFEHIQQRMDDLSFSIQTNANSVSVIERHVKQVLGIVQLLHEEIQEKKIDSKTGASSSELQADLSSPDTISSSTVTDGEQPKTEKPKRMQELRTSKPTAGSVREQREAELEINQNEKERAEKRKALRTTPPRFSFAGRRGPRTDDSKDEKEKDTKAEVQSSSSSSNNSDNEEP